MLEKFEELPIKELIAEKPVSPRDSSNLMIVIRKTGEIFNDKFFNLGNYLNPGDCLVLNKSKVWKAKIPARKKTGGSAELLLISCENESKTIWKLLSRKSKPKDEYEAPGGIKAKCIGQNEDGSFMFEFSHPLNEQYLNSNALVPLPNYIEKKRKEKGLSPFLENDCELYQTVYAEKEGSIAAPTAGFHFTKYLLNSLSKKGVIISYVTLHVGWGTFRPVRTDPKEHKMLEEQCEISQEEADIINSVKTKKNGRIAAVGTSSVRTLEKMSSDRGEIKSGRDRAELFIYPGYKFKVPDIFITNFHVPSSAPLFMTAAFCGEELLYKAYKTAVDRKYRFYSYGDSMMII